MHTKFTMTDFFLKKISGTHILLKFLLMNHFKAKTGGVSVIIRQKRKAEITQELVSQARLHRVMIVS